jgi:hypothetical protein
MNQRQSTFDISSSEGGGVPLTRDARKRAAPTPSGQRNTRATSGTCGDRDSPSPGLTNPAAASARRRRGSVSASSDAPPRRRDGRRDPARRGPPSAGYAPAHAASLPGRYTSRGDASARDRGRRDTPSSPARRLITAIAAPLHHLEAHPVLLAHASPDPSREPRERKATGR